MGATHALKSQRTVANLDVLFTREHMRFRTNFSFLARLLADRVRNEAKVTMP